MVSVAQDETACLHQSEDDEDEDADDEFADQEFDNILAEAGEDIQLLHDCAVREAVTYVVCDLVDKVVQQIEPPTNERRIQMYDFFKERLADKSWKTNQRFPKAGSNEELDQLIQRLKFKRRTDASALWRDYKSSNGIIGQIKISTSKEALLNDFKMRSARSSIVENSISSTHQYFHAEFDFSGDSFKRLLYDAIWNDNAAQLGEFVYSRVDDLNHSLACTMHNLTKTTLNKRMLSFVNKEQDGAICFAEKCVIVAKKSEDHNDLLKGWFLWLDEILRNNWTIAIKELESHDLLNDEIDVDDIDQILKGSQGTVFYIAGYLLRSVSKAKTQKIQKVAIGKFVSHNKHDKDLTCGTLLPTHVVDSREIQKGAMTRVCHKFFRFVCLMEALYKLNLNPAVAVFYRENFFHKVDTLVKNSKELALLFNDCIPVNCSPNERKQLMDGIFKLILHKYGGLRARDVLRNLKAKISVSKVAGDDFSTRTAVLVCIKAAKTTTDKAAGMDEQRYMD
jgi:hypothetical protein